MNLLSRIYRALFDRDANDPYELNDPRLPEEFLSQGQITQDRILAGSLTADSVIAHMDLIPKIRWVDDDGVSIGLDDMIAAYREEIRWMRQQVSELDPHHFGCNGRVMDLKRAFAARKQL